MLHVNLDVEFYDLDCNNVVIDVVDEENELIDSSHVIYRSRLNREGRELGRPKKSALEAMMGSHEEHSTGQSTQYCGECDPMFWAPSKRGPGRGARSARLVCSHSRLCPVFANLLGARPKELSLLQLLLGAPNLHH